MRTILFTLILMLSVACLQAQDKYEYATVRQTLVTLRVTTSKGTEEIKLEKMKIFDVEVNLLKKVEELNEQGWEVYNTTSVPEVPEIMYYLRKKKN